MHDATRGIKGQIYSAPRGWDRTREDYPNNAHPCWWIILNGCLNLLFFSRNEFFTELFKLRGVPHLRRRSLVLWLAVFSPRVRRPFCSPNLALRMKTMGKNHISSYPYFLYYSTLFMIKYENEMGNRKVCIPCIFAGFRFIRRVHISSVFIKFKKYLLDTTYIPQLSR